MLVESSPKLRAKQIGFDVHVVCAGELLRDAGGTETYSAGNFRYIGAAECDRMAQLAWLELERRVANSDGSAFINDGESRICVWRQPV